MTIKNIKLGGTTDIILNSAGVSEDINDTFDAAADRINGSLLGTAEQAAKILAASLSYENSENTMAEDATSAIGANSTISASSTAVFATDHYELGTSAGSSESSTSLTAGQNSSAGYTTNCVAIKQGIITSVNLDVGTAGAKTVSIKNSVGTTIASKAVDPPNNDPVNVTFTLSDYSELISVGNFSITATSGAYSQSSKTFNGSLFSYTSQNVSSSNNQTITPYIFQEFVSLASGTVISDETGAGKTLTLDGSEKTLTTYSKQTTPTDSTITVDISDGSTVLSAQAVNETIDISTLSSGILKLTFNLNKGTDPIGPKLFRFGGIKV